ncbi:MAG: hypothetical protein GEV08_13645 [Acidimicrobiia bacterium]|nr:hypothetical protein [Acidimicrobiia bacterium]
MRISRAALGATGLAALLGITGTVFASIGNGTLESVGATPTVAPTSVPTTTAAPTTTMAPTTTVAPTTTTTSGPPAPPVTEAPAPVEEPAVEEVVPVEEAPAPEPPAVEQAPAPVEPPAPVAMANVAASQSPAEDHFLALTNATRASVGLGPLRSDAGLHAYAVAQAQAMAAAGNIYHSDISSLLGSWWTVGENVGVGPAVAPIHDALVASPGHYANIAHGGYTSMGVGVVVDAAGRVWTAHVFGA